MKSLLDLVCRITKSILILWESLKVATTTWCFEVDCTASEHLGALGTLGTLGTLGVNGYQRTSYDS